MYPGTCRRDIGGQSPPSPYLRGERQSGRYYDMQFSGRRNLDVQLGPHKRSSTRAVQLYHRPGSQERYVGMADHRGTISRPGGSGARSEQIGT